MRKRAKLGLLLVGLAHFGCASGSHVAKSGGEEGQPPPPSGDPAEKTEGKEDSPPADVLYAAPTAVPAAPSTCAVGTPAPVRHACSEARPDLASALSNPDVTVRDQRLAALEACEEFPAGLLRALRADLGAAECGDVLVDAWVGEGKEVPDLKGDIRETLVALGLGARLRRLAVTPPAAPASTEKEALQSYFIEQLFPWIESQAQAIFVMASQGTALSGYARGVVAIEAGNADMRFVEIVRAAPIAKEIAEHEEAKDVYYATLDERLEPRKQRGRNAALVGLREMARIGVRESERVRSARSLLSSVYGGRRVNALDTLLVPSIAPEKAESDAAAIASLVPTSYTTSLIGSPEVSANLVRAHVQMGMTASMKQAVQAQEKALPRFLLARALFESGRTYFRSEDFQAAQGLFTDVLDQQETKDMEGALSAEQREDAQLLRALSVALLAGPKDAAEMIANGPRFADALGNLVLLDGLAERGGVLGGRAAFNAAYLRELIAPEGDPTYWNDLARRYRTAARTLVGKEKTLATERAAACEQIARRVLPKPSN